jgi:hypothetical protein
MLPLRQRRTRDYLIRMPKDTTVKVVCEQIRCEKWLYGWDVFANERAPLGRDRAAYFRSGASRRTFRELRTTVAEALSAGVVLPGEIDAATDPLVPVSVFRFEPHQRCFDEHRTRPARWLVRGVREHADMSGWLDDLDEHVDRLSEQIKRGFDSHV